MTTDAQTLKPEPLTDKEIELFIFTVNNRHIPFYLSHEATPKDTIAYVERIAATFKSWNTHQAPASPSADPAEVAHIRKVLSQTLADIPEPGAMLRHMKTLLDHTDALTSQIAALKSPNRAQNVINDIVKQFHEFDGSRTPEEIEFRCSHFATFIDLWNRFVCRIDGLDESSLRIATTAKGSE